ncbi:MAG TPA: tail length tape measure protein [Cyanobacteria bacterium UBA11372]|nr:tail length tape measure protein [Cyanobacteria bacterium UBA11372]
MLKQLKNPISLAVGAGISVLVLGAGFAVVRWNDVQRLVPQLGQLQQLNSNSEAPQQEQEDPKSAVLPLATVSPQQRASQLEAIASGASSLEQSRARYLLASDSIAQKQGKKALSLLEGLEQDYPVMAAHIAMKRAQAYESMGDKPKATAAWQELLAKYPENPVAAEALFVLGRKDTQLWDRAIASFPSHPRTIEIARERLKKTPNQLSLLLLLLKHDQDSRDIGTVLNQLRIQHGAQLKPEDWEAIAFLHWQRREYGESGKAYAKAPATPRNVYRAARGQQLGGFKNEAIALYQQLIRDFPTAKDTGLGLIRLSRISPQQDALIYLDRASKEFPDQAGAALLDKSKILDKNNNTKSASQARQLALKKYGNSDEVVQFRWEAARQRAKAGDFLGAWQWAQPITREHPESELAPEAGFWVGKWAAKLGRAAEAQTAYEYVISRYPESYYAWRSAGELGWNVGTFTTVRELIPQIVRPPEKPLLPAGSDAVKELYQLGQKKDARSLWQAEFSNYIQPTIAEQFTDGVLLLGVGQNIQGITQLESLGWWRDTDEEKAQLAELKKQPEYWQALYPFPYLELVENWSKQRQLNPLLVISLIRQESRFETTIRSVANAIGLMQVLPSTAAWIAPQINLKNYALENPNDNINLGTWYLDHTHETYNNNSLLAVASYNAGPGNVSNWIQKYGLNDPDEFVEDIPFPETQGYVKHVFGNYWNYMRFYNPEIAQKLQQLPPTK